MRYPLVSLKEITNVKYSNDGGIIMKQLTCEMCGSTDLVKQDGMYACQTCGTKYSVEEAKKMMIEGTVDVSGSTVKVDNTASIANYYKMAESAYESSNQKEAERYCNKIIEIDPDNYKAWLLKGRAAGWQSTLGNIRIEESVNCFTKALDNAPEEEKENVKKEAANEIEKLSKALISLCCDNYEKWPSDDNANSILSNLKLAQLYSLVLLAKCEVNADGFKQDVATMINQAVVTAWGNVILEDYQDDEHPSKYTWETFKERGFTALALLQQAIDICDDDDQDDIQRYKNMITLTSSLVNSCSWTYSNSAYVREYSLTQEAKNKNIDNIMKWHEKIKEIDPNYVIPQRPTAGGCYVATAVYGSYDCPQVWILRRYRDYTLAETWYGRAFIYTYYAISPTLVKCFGHTEWFKKMWKGKLDRMVDNLKAEGVEDTPYEDRNW